MRRMSAVLLLYQRGARALHAKSMPQSFTIGKMYFYTISVERKRQRVCCVAVGRSAAQRRTSGPIFFFSFFASSFVFVPFIPTLAVTLSYRIQHQSPSRTSKDSNALEPIDLRQLLALFIIAVAADDDDDSYLKYTRCRYPTSYRTAQPGNTKGLDMDDIE